MHLAEYAQTRLPRDIYQSIWAMPWEAQPAALRRALFCQLTLSEQHALLNKFDAWVTPRTEFSPFYPGAERICYAKRLKYIDNIAEVFDSEEEALSDAFESVQEDFAVALTFALRAALGGAK